jgi:hypothetical protein
VKRIKVDHHDHDRLLVLLTMLLVCSVFQPHLLSLLWLIVRQCSMWMWWSVWWMLLKFQWSRLYHSMMLMLMMKSLLVCQLLMTQAYDLLYILHLRFHHLHRPSFIHSYEMRCSQNSNEMKGRCKDTGSSISNANGAVDVSPAATRARCANTTRSLLFHIHKQQCIGMNRSGCIMRKEKRVYRMRRNTISRSFFTDFTRFPCNSKFERKRSYVA